MREIRFYRTAAGHCPAEEFLDSLGPKQAQKMVWVLRLVEEIDSVPAQYLKRLVGTAGLWEIRAQQGGEALRMLGFFERSDVFVLTGGFAKKSTKTPRREVETAEARRLDHLSRRRTLP